MKKIIINKNCESVQITIDAEVFKYLNSLEQYEVLELCENAESVEEVENILFDEIYRIAEEKLPIYTNKQHKEFSMLSVYEIDEILENCSDIFNWTPEDGFSKLQETILYFKNLRELQDDVHELVKNLEEEQIAFDYDELDEDIQEEIKERFNEGLYIDWDIYTEDITEAINDTIHRQGPIFENINATEWSLDYCQGSGVNGMEGYIEIPAVLDFLEKNKEQKDVKEFIESIGDYEEFVKDMNELHDEGVQFNYSYGKWNTVCKLDTYCDYTELYCMYTLGEILKREIREVVIFDLLDEFYSISEGIEEDERKYYFDEYITENKFTIEGDEI